MSESGDTSIGRKARVLSSRRRLCHGGNTPTVEPLTVAVTDGLRGDIAAFDAAIHPIIAELA
ncbi:hypothetical protein Q9S36_20990 [Microbacterium sp. ARD31]|nr:hypothetical protein [Microbacterium sp. ARD31]MDT0182654.1 hypothetical protein [Microbacterium sp. ARD31]